MKQILEYIEQEEHNIINEQLSNDNMIDEGFGNAIKKFWNWLFGGKKAKIKINDKAQYIDMKTDTKYAAITSNGYLNKLVEASKPQLPNTLNSKGEGLYTLNIALKEGLAKYSIIKGDIYYDALLDKSLFAGDALIGIVGYKKNTLLPNYLEVIIMSIDNKYNQTAAGKEIVNQLIRFCNRYELDGICVNADKINDAEYDDIDIYKNAGIDVEDTYKKKNILRLDL